jgi:enoyl-CoA hydratase
MKRMSEGCVTLTREGAIARVVFDRPEARNAMTWSMYVQLFDICSALGDDTSVRLVTFRGAGNAAFVAGTDIEQFTTFQTGDDGIAYEQKIEACVTAFEMLPMPTVAIVEGWAVGGGLILATACDFRIASTSARFGVPIAKTLGNCLSVANLARLVAAFGMARVRRMLMLADIVAAEEALEAGFLSQVCEPGDIDAAGSALCARLLALAPVTQSVTKESLQRLVANSLPDDHDLIRRCYGSDDFHEGVRAFVAKQSPVWTGH